MTSMQAQTTRVPDVCRCGHTAHWHADVPEHGSGQCEHDGECGCKAFTPSAVTGEMADAATEVLRDFSARAVAGFRDVEVPMIAEAVVAAALATSDQLDALALADAVDNLEWNVADGYEEGSPVIVSRSSWRRLLKARHPSGRFPR